jgi:hypothetical protein
MYLILCGWNGYIDVNCKATGNKQEIEYSAAQEVRVNSVKATQPICGCL